ncbi:CHAT domain-containing protein [Streptomyces sp. NPDC001978]|uniref:CHAT domain-containing protein n=1 Tax=Streptomyces sp. NPDC001978 TaxID=3364627 RepID=UPI0036B97F16
MHEPADRPWPAALDHAWQVLQDALETASATGNPAVTLAPQVADAADAVTATIAEPPDVPGPEPTQDMATRQAVGWYHWFRYQALGEGEDEQELLMAVVILLPLMVVRPDIVPVPLADLLHGQGADRADRLLALGTNLLHWARAHPHPAVARASAVVLEHTLAAAPGTSQEAALLGNLATAQLTVFERTGDLSALDDAVDSARRAASSPDEQRPGVLGNLGAMLLARHRRTGSAEDLTDGISASRAALEGAPTSPTVVVQLGGALRTRYRRHGRRTDLDEALALCRRAARLAEERPGTHSAVLSQLGSCLQDLFELDDEPETLAEAITVRQDALDALSPDHAERPAALTNLAHSLRARALRLGDTDAAERAVALGREAVDMAGPDGPERPLAVSGLATALRVVFQLAGDAEALRESVNLFREVLDHTGADAPELLGRVSNLGTSLWASYEHSGSIGDLDEALAVLRDPRAARALHRADPSEIPGFLNNLATALLAAHERTGDLALLDEAVDVGREAVEASVGPANRALCLSVLGNALLTRFEASGAEAYLHEALTVMEGAVSALPDDHGDRPRLLSNLGNALRVHHDRSRHRDILDHAVELLERAVDTASSEHPDRASYLVNLAASLHTRYEATEDPEDLDRAIALWRNAARDAVSEGPDHVAALTNLGGALLTRYERLRDPDVLKQAVDVTRSAEELLSETHPHRAIALGHLGSALRARHRLSGRESDLNDALDAFRLAAHSQEATISPRLAGARARASLAAEASRWAQALEAHREAFALLPRLVARQLSRSDQEFRLGATAGLAGDAAACALHTGDPSLALQLLEQGRGLLFGQLLDIQSDLGDLRAEAPELARRLEEIGRALDSPATPAAPVSSGQAALRTAREVEEVRAVERRADLDRAWEDTLTTIRKLPGRSGFLAPPSPAELLAEAAAGPVVALNVSDIRSDALILTTRGIQVVPLPGVDPATVRRQVDVLLDAVSAAHDPELPLERSSEAQNTLHSLLEWLWDTIAEPVVGALDAAGALDDPQGSRLWWMPTGALAFLPLHAAGHHRAGESWRTVLDRAVSSYTPTVRSLRHLRRRHTATAAPRRLLTVGLAEAEGTPELAGTTQEAGRVGAAFPGSTVLNGPEATRAHVLDLLPGHPWVHFACHGHSDAASPSRSSLLLHDHRAHPLTMLDIDHLRLTDAQLAFLSACSTAQTSAAIPDESLHIAAAFLLAGFPQVVATLWPLSDQLAAEFAEDFYQRFPTLDPVDAAPSATPAERPAVPAARALHAVVRDHRSWYVDAPSLWACHIHTGI